MVALELVGEKSKAVKTTSLWGSGVCGPSCDVALGDGLYTCNLVQKQCGIMNRAQQERGRVGSKGVRVWAQQRQQAA